MVTGQLRQTSFEDWTDNREIASLGTNHGAKALPFQDWHKFKEAFAPELIARAIDESPKPVRRCIDPFAGSGTTGLACQFLGVHPILGEVNPYLADLVEAKLTSYPSEETLLADLERVLEMSACDSSTSARKTFEFAPRTLVEPGRDGRWIFSAPVAERIVAIRDAIEHLDAVTQRLFRVLLGGTLIEVSNVRVSGKGRRYRRDWKNRDISPARVSQLFYESAIRAIGDIGRYANRPVTTSDVLRGDSRVALNEVEGCELAVFSPPYPNSFDYTDVYNVELWALGYLGSWDDNATLRSATISSHVQVSRDFPLPPNGSTTLRDVMDNLDNRRHMMWDDRIPAMIGAYFNDLLDVLGQLQWILADGGTAWMVVGDSRYAGIQIPVAKILQELVPDRGWRVLASEPFRSMRTSAQQGGRKMLAEQLIVLQNES